MSWEYSMKLIALVSALMLPPPYTLNDLKGAELLLLTLNYDPIAP